MELDAVFAYMIVMTMCVQQLQNIQTAAASIVATRAAISIVTAFFLLNPGYRRFWGTPWVRREGGETMADAVERKGRVGAQRRDRPH